jgi:hypothetical protein
MSRFKLDHLVDEHLVAECGFDPFVGFFAEVRDVRRSKPKLIYDKMQPAYDHKLPLLGVLKFLEAQGFIVLIEESLAALEHPEPEHLPSGIKRTIDVVMQFKRAAE